MLTIISVLFSIALITLIFFQMHWINRDFNIKKELFEDKIDRALNNTSAVLAKIDTANKFKRTVSRTQGFISKSGIFPYLKLKTEVSVDSNGKQSSRYSINEFKLDSLNLLKTDEATKSFLEKYLKKKNQSAEKRDKDLIQTGIQARGDFFDLTTVYNIYDNYRSSVDSIKLDSILKNELRKEAIFESYKYFITLRAPESANRNDLHYAEHLTDSLGVVYLKNLIPDNQFMAPRYLVLHFPNQDKAIFDEILGFVIISAIIILILIFSFYYIIHNNIKQKKLSQIKNDFISNMTHEFKTPISTIALAGEMLSDASISQTPDKQQRYLKMIRDENKRLSVLVESILQTSILDRGTFNLKLSELDIHEVINTAINNTHLLISQKHGSIETKLTAQKFKIQADRVHLTNIIFNLIDNAIKYSKDIPEVVISTYNTPEGIMIEVKDSGLGISKEHQKRIFEKFYRVPTGNVHNVKGFGLGLSYVLAVVMKHGGTISVDSEPGKGSTFKVHLPIT
ncbi:MAG: HAMP domain-containing histidine kinase [Bacteroidetes bacterium]|nr:HAMP domain-containing histidine kinase [Bacteroidota bacterium]